MSPSPKSFPRPTRHAPRGRLPGILVGRKIGAPRNPLSQAFSEAQVATALIVYRSHTGVTRRYGEAIAAHLTGRGIDAKVVSVGECDLQSLASVDYLLLGCWTSGLFVVGQHPDGPWLSFVRQMPAIGDSAAGETAGTTAAPKVALFTTYQLRTGSQFPKMRAALKGKAPSPTLELKSRNGRLTDHDKSRLNDFLA